MNFNQVTIAGNLTRDPVQRFTNGGKAVTDFGLAINEKYGEQETTIFIDVTCWGRTAELVTQYLSKGSSALVSGRLSFDSWEKDGVKRTKIFVTAERVQFGDSKRQGNGGNGGARQGNGSHSGGGQNQSRAPQTQPQYTEDAGNW
jgi:single-strand DNA-binding protein